MKVAMKKDGLTVYVYPVEVPAYKRDGWKKVVTRKKSD